MVGKLNTEMMMKTYKYIVPFMVVLSTILGCERRHLEDNLLESTVYFSRSGLQSASFYDVEGTYEYPLFAANTGYFPGETHVFVSKEATVLNTYNQENGTSLKELPSDCYLITEGKGKITKEERVSRFGIQFDCDKLRALSQEADYSDLEDYVVPLQLTTDGGIKASEQGNMILVRPQMKQMTVSVVSPGEVTVAKSDIVGTLTFEFPVKTTLENRWITTFKTLTGNEAIDRMNTTLLSRGSLKAYSALTAMPSDAYTITFDDTIHPGTSTATMTVKVDATKVPEGCTSIVLWLEGAAILGEEVSVEGMPYMIIHFQNVAPISTVGLIPANSANTTVDGPYLGKYLEGFGYTVIPRTGWIFSPDSYHNNSYPNAIDGSTTTIWENRYNDNAGSVGPKTLLFNAIVDLGQVRTFNAIELWRRAHATYISDLRAFEIYISDDQINWKYVTTIDYGTATNQRAMYNVFQKVNARYVNLYMTRSNRSAAVSIAELFLWNK